jgi:hypothetical protein
MVGDAQRDSIVLLLWTRARARRPISRVVAPPAAFLFVMPKLSPTVQRLILAFTTGLFLACAAHVSTQPGGMSSAMSTHP